MECKNNEKFETDNDDDDYDDDDDDCNDDDGDGDDSDYDGDDSHDDDDDDDDYGRSVLALMTQACAVYRVVTRSSHCMFFPSGP